MHFHNSKNIKGSYYSSQCKLDVVNNYSKILSIKINFRRISTAPWRHRVKFLARDRRVTGIWVNAASLIVDKHRILWRSYFKPSYSAVSLPSSTIYWQHIKTSVLPDFIGTYFRAFYIFRALRVGLIERLFLALPDFPAYTLWILRDSAGCNFLIKWDQRQFCSLQIMR